MKENKQIQVFQRIKKKKNPPEPEHVTVKMLKIKDKEKILKAARVKHTYKGRISAKFPSETMQTRKW